MLFGHLSDLATMPEMNPALRHAMEKALAFDPASLSVISIFRSYYQVKRQLILEYKVRHKM